MGVAKRRGQPLRDVRQMWREQTELDILSWLPRVFEPRGGKEKRKNLLNIGVGDANELIYSKICGPVHTEGPESSL